MANHGTVGMVEVGEGGMGWGVVGKRAAWQTSEGWMALDRRAPHTKTPTTRLLAPDHRTECPPHTSH